MVVTRLSKTAMEAIHIAIHDSLMYEEDNLTVCTHYAIIWAA